MIKNDAPENVHVILHENISETDLHDTKHIQIKKIGKMVKNMKDKMRTVIGVNTRSLTNERNQRYRNTQPHEEYKHKDMRNQLFTNQANNGPITPDMRFMNSVMKEFQKSNQQMFLELKDSLLSSLR